LKRALQFILIVLLLIPLGCNTPQRSNELSEDQEYRLELLTEIKAFEIELGFDETENFKTFSDEIVSYDYCFFTPRTTLPYSLDDPLLQRSKGKLKELNIDTDKYDVYYYPIEAIAGIGTPVTVSLLRAPLPRFIHIIFHEDWHEQMDLPLGIEEPCAEVVSYAAAMLFAGEKFGQDSAVYRTLEKQFYNKLRESKVYQQYYDELNLLYASFHSGEISEAETLARKTELLGTMADDLKDIWGASPSQLNNAFIALQITYYRHLPLVYQAHAATDFNLAETIAIFRSVPEQGVDFATVEELKRIENEATRYLKEHSQ
jgi:hypothetical protein